MTEGPISISTREKFSLRSASPLQEIDHPTDAPVKRGGRGGRIATTLTAAMLAAACSSPAVAPVESSSPSKPPGVEQVQVPSAIDIVKKLEGDPEVKKGETNISLTELKKQYQEADYQWFKSGSELIGNIESAPVLTLSYDAASKKLLFQDQSPHGLSKQDMFNLLSPLVRNDILKTALATGKLDQVVFRVAKKNTDPLYTTADIFNGFFYAQDLPDPKKGLTKSIFNFLPGNTDSLNILDLDRNNDHEGLHSLTADNSLSKLNKEQPNAEAIGEWKQVCTDIRNFAIDDAEKHRQSILTLMKGQERLFPTETGKLAWKEIYQALQNGDFNRYQPTSPDVSEFKRKLPECITDGPWRSFLQLINIDKDLPKITGESNDPVYALRVKLMNEWSKVMENDTIYSLFREGPYDKNAGAETSDFGHPESDWDEAIVSITDIILNDPNGFAENIRQLSTDRKPAALGFIDIAVKTLDVAVPQDQIEFHIRLRSQYELFKAVMAK